MPIDKLSKSPLESKLPNPNLDKAPSHEAEISPHNQDVLLHIASLIRLAEGFRLGFVKCNQPIQRSILAARLKEMLASEATIFEVELTESVESLRAAVLQKLEDYDRSEAGKLVVMVYGFDRSVSTKCLAPSLEELNLSRELFSRDFPFPFLIWLPDYALTRLAREAPDFWGWRSGVFEFQPDLRLMDFVERIGFPDIEMDSSNLSEKRVHIEVLEGLVRDYAELQRGERENLALAAVLHRLGIARFQLGEYDEARRLYRKSLEINLDLKNKPGVANSLQTLGNLAYVTGDYAEALRLYQESLKIERELGDKRGIATALDSLGNLAQDTGDYTEARKLHRESLNTFQDLGNKRGISASLHNLGILAHATGDYAEARRLYHESLEIERELGDKAGVARTLHHLGMLAHSIGDYAEASRLYETSLEIDQEIGDKYGVAINYHNLGALAYATNDFTEARRLYRESLKIEEELKDKSGMAQTLHQLGNFAYATSDYSEAYQLYQNSLKISQDLGYKEGKALTLAQLALLEEKKGNIKEALCLIKIAEDIFLELESPMADKAQRTRERLEKNG